MISYSFKNAEIADIPSFTVEQPNVININGANITVLTALTGIRECEITIGKFDSGGGTTGAIGFGKNPVFAGGLDYRLGTSPGLTSAFFARYWYFGSVILTWDAVTAFLCHPIRFSR